MGAIVTVPELHRQIEEELSRRAFRPESKQANSSTTLHLTAKAAKVSQGFQNPPIHDREIVIASPKDDSSDSDTDDDSPHHVSSSTSGFGNNSFRRPSMRTEDSTRRMSLLETMLLTKQPQTYETRFNQFPNELTVGDIVRVPWEEPNRALPYIEGIIVEKVNDNTLNVDFGDSVRQVPVTECTLLLRVDEFEEGDKVEARPNGSTLFFVGKVIKVNPDKSINVLMEGDDDDIEYGIPPENARKLMSRRALVRNRWRKAFMMIVAANFFRRITFIKTVGQAKSE